MIHFLFLFYYIFFFCLIFLCCFFFFFFAFFFFFFFFQAEDGIRDPLVMEFRRVLFRSLAERADPPFLAQTRHPNGIAHFPWTRSRRRADRWEVDRSRPGQRFGQHLAPGRLDRLDRGDRKSVV